MVGEKSKEQCFVTYEGYMKFRFQCFIGTSHACLFTSCLWLLSHYNSWVELLKERPWGPQSRKYLLLCPLQSNFADPYSGSLVPLLPSFYKWGNGNWEFQFGHCNLSQMVKLRLDMLDTRVAVRAFPEQHRQAENSKNKNLWGSCSALQCPLREFLEGDSTQRRQVWVGGVPACVIEA